MFIHKHGRHDGVWGGGGDAHLFERWHDRGVPGQRRAEEAGSSLAGGAQTIEVGQEGGPVRRTSAVRRVRDVEDCVLRARGRARRAGGREMRTSVPSEDMGGWMDRIEKAPDDVVCTKVTRAKKGTREEALAAWRERWL